MVGLLLLIGFAVGVSGAGLSSSSDQPETGRLELDGKVYWFAPTTCTITDSDFLAAGRGEVDGEPFWISASADRVNLTVGQESEVERPADDQLWLMSVAGVSWQAKDHEVTAAAVMRDERDTKSRSFRGSLSVECPPA